MSTGSPILTPFKNTNVDLVTYRRAGIRAELLPKQCFCIGYAHCILMRVYSLFVDAHIIDNNFTVSRI